MQIGYAGLGKMGGALARRLQLSHPLRAFDPDRGAVAKLVDAGATAVADLRSLARDCDVVFLCLPTSDHVRQAVFGPAGLSDGLKPGTLLVDQSTGFPEATRQMACELEKRGVELIDAPVSGGPGGTAAGTITIMVGASDDQFRRIEPVLRDISSDVVHAGAVGNGQVVKIVNNLVSFTQRLVTYEGITLGVKNGVDPNVVAGVLSTSTAQNGYIHRVLVPKVLKGDLNLGFTLGLTQKDMALASRLGEQSAVPLAIGNLARQMYERFGEELGYGAEVELSGTIMQREAGTRFIPSE